MLSDDASSVNKPYEDDFDSDEEDGLSENEHDEGFPHRRSRNTARLPAAVVIH